MIYSREELALDALIAASLRAVEFQKEIPQSEIDSCLNDKPVLSDSNRKLLDRLSNDVFLAASTFEIHEEVAPSFEESSQYVDAVMAMNRKNANDEISEETRKEIEEKREKLKKKLAEKRKKKNNGTAD